MENATDKTTLNIDCDDMFKEIVEHFGFSVNELFETGGHLISCPMVNLSEALFRFAINYEFHEKDRKIGKTRLIIDYDPNYTKVVGRVWEEPSETMS